MAEQRFQLGMNARLYYKEGGQDESGPWVELGNAKDVTLNLETDEADVTTRANKGWKAIVATLKSASVEFEMVWDRQDPGFKVIRNAFLNNRIVGIQVLDGPAEGGEEPDGQGLQADWMITSFKRNEPLGEAITVSVTIKITYSATPPTWIGDD